MPTDVRIQGVHCVFMGEQDPPVFVCNYRFQEVATGDAVPAEIANDVGDNTADGQDEWATANDYTIV